MFHIYLVYCLLISLRPRIGYSAAHKSVISIRNILYLSLEAKQSIHRISLRILSIKYYFADKNLIYPTAPLRWCVKEMRNLWAKPIVREPPWRRSRSRNNSTKTFYNLLRIYNLKNVVFKVIEWCVHFFFECGPL